MAASDLVGSIVGPYTTMIGVIQLALMFMIAREAFRGFGGGLKGAAGAPSTRNAADWLRNQGNKVKQHDQKVREYNELANRLNNEILRSSMSENDKLRQIQNLLNELEQLDRKYGVP